jgi:PKD repeat protein
MIARLSSRSYPELTGLTTRDPGDFSIALLDAWATVADVLTFYQERIANEGYLRTATERRSILELAKLVGYTPRPGVASSVYLAYELEKGYREKVEIPAGERAQSLPAPGELPQSFETSEPLSARAEWNEIKPRMTRPMNITVQNDTINVNKIYLKGTALNLKPNDKVLFVFDKTDNTKNILLTVNEVNIQPTDNRTEVVFDKVKDASTSTITAKKEIIKWLSKLPNLQPAGSLFLNREVGKILKIGSSDFVTQALVSLNPRISNTLYPALSNVNLVEKEAELKGVYVLRIKAALFGYNAPPPKGPVAKFTITPEPKEGIDHPIRKFEFEDKSDGAPTSRIWDFGDESTSNDEKTSHEFTKEGTYSVLLTVENAGGTSTATETIYVFPKRPIAKINWKQDPNDIHNIIFEGESLGGEPTSWEWDFGDGNKSTDKSTNNKFGSAIYTVSLTVKNAGGTSTATIDINLTGPN